MFPYASYVVQKKDSAIFIPYTRNTEYMNLQQSFPSGHSTPRLPETYGDYSLIMYIEEYGLLGAALMLLPPLILLTLVYLMLRRRHKGLFFVILGGYLLYNAVYVAMHYITLRKPYIGAVLVFLPVFMYWLVNRLNPKSTE